jgi:hypothetical protein
MGTAIPEDRALEEHVTGAVLACWLRAEEVDPDVMYHPAHARLVIAARFLAARDRLRPEYETRRGQQIVLTVRGLDGALVATGSPHVAEDVARAERLATVAPACTRFDVDRLHALAARRCRLLKLYDEYERVAAGECDEMFA